MGVSRARRIAFEVLLRVERERAFAADLLHARLEELRGPQQRADAALATELTLGVLRRQRLLDFLIERQLTKAASSLDLEVLLALRLGLYQLRWLDRVPKRAAVSESVELTKRARKASAAGLVNAVLRGASSIARQSLEEIGRLLPAGPEPAERLGTLYSHPTWMVTRWLATFDEPRTLALLEANNRAPRLTCAVRDANRQDEMITSLHKGGFEVEPGQWLRSAVSIRGGNPATTKAFRRGAIAIQDEASQMIPLLLAVEPGHSVLDLCAAPGGKTTALADAAGPQAHLVAADLHAHRLRAMRQQLRGAGGGARVNMVALDATTPLPLAGLFDRVLVDAPCSGTGTLARNPEIRWRLRLEDLADFHRRQVLLLSHAFERLAPGGRLVYSTCSLEPEENEHVVVKVIQQNRNIRTASGAPALAAHLLPGRSAGSLFDSTGYFRTFPPEHHTDGFFAAILEHSRG